MSSFRPRSMPSAAGRSRPSGRGGSRRTAPLVAAAVGVVAVIVALVAAVAFGGGSGGAGKPAGITVHTTEYRFSPPAVTVPRGGTVVVVNDGTLAHTWVLRGAGVGTADIQPGRNRRLSLTGVAPGAYQVFCDIPGHAQLGQVGTLTILP